MLLEKKRSCRVRCKAKNLQFLYSLKLDTFKARYLLSLAQYWLSYCNLVRELLILCKILYSYQSKKAKLTSNVGLYNNKFRVLSKLVALSLSVLVLFFSNLDVLYLQD